MSLAVSALFFLVLLCSGLPMFTSDDATAQEPGSNSAAGDEAANQITSIEGITEYRLPNGTQVLLFPDDSKSMVTVNMTVFVGSRHEGYGEAGMAHLLEHMLFKGTPGFENIPDELKNRGANFNGTTWLDRTNYFETLPATSAEQSEENLKFAIRLEADRLMNSYIRGEDLIAEMPVVRNEFERGENSPNRILSQRVQSTMYDWHNYGRSTIGNQSDIERVPVDRLKDFYRKFYRPDNIMVVIAGKFDKETALQLVQDYFGILEAPSEPLDKTYTTEPAQDGERTVVLRRVGNVQLVSAAYHAPSGASREYAAVEMLAYIFGTEPSGRLYQKLVVPELASGVTTRSMALYDPGSIMFSAQVPTTKSIESARQTLLETVENVAGEPISEEELTRAKRQFFKDRELRATDTREIAIELSEWAAQGDWRLYFLFRDYVESLTPEDCTAAAQAFMTRNNRTVGLFLPAEESERIEIPTKPDLDELLAGYEGRGEIDQGEEFDPSPMAVEARTTRSELKCGLKTAFLPKKTRGQTVHLRISLRYGNEESLLPYRGAIDFLPVMLMRGTESLDYQQLQDRLDELRAQVNFSGTAGLLTASIETKSEHLEELLPLIGEIMRKPRFDEAELAVLLRQSITSAEAAMTEPNALAAIATQRALAPYSKDNMRYVPTLEERVDQMKAITIEQIRELHAEQLGATHGEITAVGDFDPDRTVKLCDAMFAGWQSSVPHERIPNQAQEAIPGKLTEIETPDKANAVYYGSMQIRMRDDHPDYPALMVGNYVMGGGAMSSRLGKRVRIKESLSYGVGSGLNSHPVDERTSLTLFAISSPDNKERLIQVINEEVEMLLRDGITEAELSGAKQGILQSSQLGRTQDGNLAGLLVGTIFAGRDMAYYADYEKRIDALTVGEVNAALKKYIDPSRLVVHIAGDFAKSAETDD